MTSGLTLILIECIEVDSMDISGKCHCKLVPILADDRKSIPFSDGEKQRYKCVILSRTALSANGSSLMDCFFVSTNIPAAQTRFCLAGND